MKNKNLIADIRILHPVQPPEPYVITHPPPSMRGDFWFCAVVRPVWRR